MNSDGIEMKKISMNKVIWECWLLAADWIHLTIPIFRLLWIDENNMHIIMLMFYVLWSANSANWIQTPKKRFKWEYLNNHRKMFVTISYSIPFGLPKSFPSSFAHSTKKNMGTPCLTIEMTEIIVKLIIIYNAIG